MELLSHARVWWKGWEMLLLREPPPSPSLSTSTGGLLDRFVQPPPISCCHPQSPEQMVSSVPVYDVMKGCDVLSPVQCVEPLRCHHLNVLPLDVH